MNNKDNVLIFEAYMKPKTINVGEVSDNLETAPAIVGKCFRICIDDINTGERLDQFKNIDQFNGQRISFLVDGKPYSANIQYDNSFDYDHINLSDVKPPFPFTTYPE